LLLVGSAQEVCKAVAVSERGRCRRCEIAAHIWANGEYPFDCRICGELWIDCGTVFSDRMKNRNNNSNSETVNAKRIGCFYIRLQYLR